MLTTIVAGHLCVDLVPEVLGPEPPRPGELLPAGPLRMSVGGCVGNTGRAIAGLGMPVLLQAAVGRDGLGALAGELLAEAVGRERLRLVASAEATSYSIVIDPPGGDRAFWHHVGANASFAEVSLGGGDILHVGYPTALPALSADRGRLLSDLLTRARDAGLTTSIDLSSAADPVSAARDWPALLETVLPLVDLVSPSVDDLRRLVPELEGSTAEEAAAWLVRRGAAIAMVTDGPAGAVMHYAGAGRLRDGGRALASQARPPASVISATPRAIADGLTTGAGDAASAGLLAAAACGLPLALWASAAVAVASAHVAGARLGPGLLRGLG